MFRTMRRFKQELTREECLAVLRSQPRGVLSLLGENGYPYGLPIDYWYNETDGKLYFHGAKEGHKIDAIRACDKASFCVHDEGQRVAGEWPLHFCSVIVFGRIAPVTDAALTETAAAAWPKSSPTMPLISTPRSPRPGTGCSAWP